MTRPAVAAWLRKAALAVYPALCVAAYLVAVFMIERMHR